MTRSLTAVLAVLLGGFSAKAAAQPFTDVTSGSGLERRNVKDGGQTWADFDGDGYLDVLVNTSNRSHLYFQRPGADPLFEDVTATNALGLSRVRGERSAVAADLNNDGYVDLMRTDQQLLEVYLNGGPPDYFFGGVSGVPSFLSDTTTDPLVDAYEGLGVFDWNDDGYLDLLMDNDGELRIYENPADGTANFVLLDAATTGIPDPATGEGDYLAVADWDVDGRVDIGHRNGASRDLWHREADGSFTGIDLGDLRSDTGRRGGMTFCDIDNDGDFDVFYTSGFGTGINQAWLQDDTGAFALMPVPDLTSTNNDDVDCGDIDNDGDLDLYYSQNNVDDVFLNQLAESGTLDFVNVTANVATRQGEGVVLVDYDNDGDLDVYSNQWGGTTTDPVTMVTTENPADNALLRNDTDDDRYLAVTILAEVQGCPGSVTRVDTGAVARLERTGWQSGVREVSGGDGHGTQGSPVLHFGLGGSPDEEHVLTVWFQYGDFPAARIRVTPSALGAYQHLTIVGSDPDGDGIPTAVEMADAGSNPDPDGDGFDAWNDADADGDGLPDADEAGDDDPCTDPVDTDGDSVPEYLDTVVGVSDAGVPDGGSVDGGTPDSSVAGDGATVDTAPFTAELVSHGSGCVRCAASTGTDDRRGALATVLVMALALWRRRCRHR